MLIRWLRSQVIKWRNRHDPAWAPTGLKFTTPRDYLQAQAIANARKARRRSETGRKLYAPKRPAQATVTPFRRKAKEAARG